MDLDTQYKLLTSLKPIYINNSTQEDINKQFMYNNNILQSFINTNLNKDKQENINNCPNRRNNYRNINNWPNRKNNYRKYF